MGMLRRETSQSYQEFSDGAGEQIPDLCQEDVLDEEPDESKDAFQETEDHAVVSYPLMGFDKACLKNVFSTILMLIYLMLTTGAAFLAYQTITDFMQKLNHPVMSVTYKEVDYFEPAGISLYLGKAQLLSCMHHHHDHIPPLVSPGQPEIGDCVTEEVTYTAPYSNHTTRKALVVQGPTDVRNRELIFLQLSQNLTEEDFSAISYMLFSKFSDLINSRNKASFMQDCERNYSMWTFSGGFRTWVKMSLVKTSGKEVKSVEFRQESGVVKYNDKRPETERTNELFFVVFQWRDPFIQEVQDIVTANPWNTIAILCGVFLALFKAADFAKQSVKWMIKIRKRHLKRRQRELTHIT
ncbi:proton-activated chloride channel isoform X1 [Anguilla anguilla]|uniref:proton-activated chloride channel isoform X1 n=1 Tax=Anguilla anguilla TaxID=7936 RepID=UPI0015AD0E2A|nr:proton-activated chloride channel isoform X1 [Anguilla anguilla]